MVEGLSGEVFGCWSGRGFSHGGGRGGGWRRGGGHGGIGVNLYGQRATQGEGRSTSMAGGSALEALRNLVMSAEAGHLDAGALDLTMMGSAGGLRHPEVAPLGREDKVVLQWQDKFGSNKLELI